MKRRTHDEWIGWHRAHRFDRLRLVASNTRLLILPGCHCRNFGSRFLSICRKRLGTDWQDRFGQLVALLEYFEKVEDPRRRPSARSP